MKTISFPDSRPRKKGKSYSQEYIMQNIQIDPTLYREAEAVFAQLGLPIDIAVTLFLRQAVLRGGLPFPVTLPDKSASPVQPEETLSQIDIPDADIPSEATPAAESFGWMGQLFEELLKETESVKAECEQENEK